MGTNIVFTIDSETNPVRVLEMKSDGEFYVKGKQAANPMEVVQAVREFVDYFSLRHRNGEDLVLKTPLQKALPDLFAGDLHWTSRRDDGSELTMMSLFANGDIAVKGEVVACVPAIYEGMIQYLRSAKQAPLTESSDGAN